MHILLRGMLRDICEYVEIEERKPKMKSLGANDLEDWEYSSGEELSDTQLDS